jgi:hypothetical protein
MQRVWGFIKVVVVLGALGWVGWFIYQKTQEEPPKARDVYWVAKAISDILGDEKTELSNVDKPSVEFQVSKIRGADPEEVKKGLLLLDQPIKREDFVAAELVLLFMYGQKPDTYESRIEGDPWEVSGELIQMGQFEIDRAPNPTKPIEDLVAGYEGMTPRSDWVVK